MCFLVFIANREYTILMKNCYSRHAWLYMFIIPATTFYSKHL